MNRQKDKMTKDKKTKKNEKKTKKSQKIKRQKISKRQKDPKEILILWFQGSFALLQFLNPSLMIKDWFWIL